MPTTDGSNDPLVVGTIKIKQEKLTPPASPNIDKISATELNITDNLLENVLDERKPIAEPIKSSNEILADLFKVLNAAPPTLDSDNDENGSTKDSTHKKKKNKKEKKLKKHKKRSRSNSKSSSDESPKNKSKKAKKSKKSNGNDRKTVKKHKKSKEREIKTVQSDVVIKKEKFDETDKKSAKNEIESTPYDDTKSKKTEEKKQPLSIQVSVTKDNDGSIGKRKIVIKSLVDSTVYQETLKEVDVKQKAKEHSKLKEKAKERTRDKDRRKHSSRRSKSHEKDHRRARSRSSSLSLSDEETYLQERERYRVS